MRMDGQRHAPATLAPTSGLGTHWASGPASMGTDNFKLLARSGFETRILQPVASQKSKAMTPSQ